MGVCRAENEKVGIPAREEKTEEFKCVWWCPVKGSVCEHRGGGGAEVDMAEEGLRCRQLHSRAVGLRPHHGCGREVREDSLKTISLES